MIDTVNWTAALNKSMSFQSYHLKPGKNALCYGLNNIEGEVTAAAERLSSNSLKWLNLQNSSSWKPQYIKQLINIYSENKCVEQH